MPYLGVMRIEVRLHAHFLLLNLFAWILIIGCVRLQLQIESGGFRTGLIWGVCPVNMATFWSGTPPDRQPHALPYIVVELEFLASGQSRAFFFRSIVKSNLELCSCARPIAHHAHRPYQRQYYCCSCRPYTTSSS
jgi:hypothetical protein